MYFEHLRFQYTLILAAVLFVVNLFHNPVPHATVLTGIVSPSSDYHASPHKINNWNAKMKIFSKQLQRHPYIACRPAVSTGRIRLAGTSSPKQMAEIIRGMFTFRSTSRPVTAGTHYRYFD
jgi:hypothetical protein